MRQRIMLALLALVVVFAASGCAVNFRHYEGEGAPPAPRRGPYHYGPRYQCRPRLICNSAGCKQVPGRYCYHRRHTHQAGRPQQWR
jgi:hypothetical protein